MTYCELKKEQEKELNEFTGIFYAFNNKQFKEGMEKIGLEEKDTKKIYSLGSGGYILKEKSKAFNDMFNKFSDKKTKALKTEEFLLEALTYELQNHEFCITYDYEQTFEALGLTIEDIEGLSFGLEVLNKAKNVALQCC